jgi:hypothetical protein
MSGWGITGAAFGKPLDAPKPEERLPVEAVLGPAMGMGDIVFAGASFAMLRILHPRFGWLSFALPEEGINVLRLYLAGRDGAKQ